MTDPSNFMLTNFLSEFEYILRSRIAVVGFIIILLRVCIMDPYKSKK